MKRVSILFFATFYFLEAFSQSPVDFGKLLDEREDTAILSTTDFLTMIDWQGIKDYCKDSHGYFVYEVKDSLISTYGYTSVLRGDASLEIVSYKGAVIEYTYKASGFSKQDSNSFFSKTVWLQCVDEILPSLPEKFKISSSEPGNILKAYYELLGANTWDVYGYICGLSRRGKVTGRRGAVFRHLSENRIDLLKKLMDYPNLQTRLYAIDVLIYNDYTARQKIKELEKKVKVRQKQLNHLQKKKADESKIIALKDLINSTSDSISNFNPTRLTEAEWKMIYDLRDSELGVKLCGNPDQETLISKVLTNKRIAEIPKLFLLFKNNGYFK